MGSLKFIYKMIQEDIEFINIKQNEKFLGYFFQVAMSRSGHYFIKKNIQSWTNDSSEKIRKYVNLESPDSNKILSLLDHFSNTSNSIHVLNLRSLLNWYSSFFYFAMVWTQSPLKRHETRIYITKSDLSKNPKLEKDPRIFILQDGESKEDYMKRNISVMTYENGDEFIIKQLDKWLFLAKEFIGETNYLPQFIKIYYDDFFINREYRKEICNKIGGVYNEDNLNIVTMAGNYSTFDKDRFQNKGQQMDVLKRWKRFKPEHHKYLTLLKEHDAMDFYLNNFDVSEEEKQFIDNI